MTGRRYVARHLRDQKYRPAESTIDDLKAEYDRLGNDVSELEFRIALMPDGREKIQALLVACEIYVRREDVALAIDYRLAKRGRAT